MKAAGSRFAAVAAVTLAGCAPTKEKPAVAPPPPIPDRECFPPGAHFAFIGTDTTLYRQGTTVRLKPMVDQSPAGTRELPSRCAAGWSVEGPATLSADKGTLVIAPDAPVGSTVRVGFLHSGKSVQLSFRVVAKDAVLLTGRWSQKSLKGCRAVEPVRELEFLPENRFAVTFVPFETYRDYWGTYAYDPATKRLSLKVEGDNFLPAGLDLEGEAELAGGRLTLKGIYLGGRDGAPQSGCTYIF